MKIYFSLFFLLLSLGCGSNSMPRLAATVVTNIADGTVGVSPEQKFTATFTQAIVPSSVDPGSFFLVTTPINANNFEEICHPAQAILAEVSCSSNLSCSLTPTSPLNFSSSYALCLTDAIQFKDFEAFGHLEPRFFSFTTRADNIAASYTVSGSVSELNGTVILQNNGGDDLSLVTDGNFTFATALVTGDAYDVSVFTPPAGQECLVSSGSGSIAGSNVTNVLVTCQDLIPPPVLPTLLAINPSSGSAAGNTGVVLTGSNLTGTISVTFDGIAATSVNVVNSTTVTAVTPAHVAGVVDVVLTTPDGNAVLTNGYTYLTASIGQASAGGTIACLNGGLNNLIAATADNSAGIEWSDLGISTNAQSNTDGASNTVIIISTLGNNGGTPYAAQLCDNYEVDSQGNTPCQAGNTCYADWFLPAEDQLNCLFNNRVAIGGFSTDIYWSSTEFVASPQNFSTAQSFVSGFQLGALKANILRARCVRSLAL